MPLNLPTMATEVDAWAYLPQYLRCGFIRGEDITMKVSMAKAWLGEMFNRVATSGSDSRRLWLYAEKYGSAVSTRHVRALPIFAGTTEIMKVIVARRLGLSPLY